MANKIAMQQRQAVRAERFTVRLPIRYRAVSATSSWVEGTTRNISRTGVLFSGKRAFPVGTKIELSLTLPLQVKVPLAATVLCRGEVVRVNSRKPSATQMGARFRESHLTDGDAAA